MYNEEIGRLFSTYWTLIMDRIPRLIEMLETNPQDCFLLHALGLEYAKLGDVQAAKTYFERVLNTDPTYVGTYYQLAKLLEQLGDSIQAISVYEKGMEQAKASNDLHAYNELRSAWEELTF